VLIELARLYGANRELSIADERARIARELHDSLTQNLFGIRLALRTATVSLGSDGESDPQAEASPVVMAMDQLERSSALLDSAFDQRRALIWDLQPPDLESDRLSGVISKQLALLERTSGLQVELTTIPEADSLAAEREHQVLRIVQEAMTNAARHADAGRLEVTFAMADNHAESTLLRIDIADDGHGFDPDRPAIRSRRLGLTSMRERARDLGGQISIDSAEGRGTTVSVEVPLD
jgi:signal transduction histidine kinase